MERRLGVGPIFVAAEQLALEHRHVGSNVGAIAGQDPARKSAGSRSARQRDPFGLGLVGRAPKRRQRLVVRRAAGDGAIGAAVGHSRPAPEIRDIALRLARQIGFPIARLAVLGRLAQRAAQAGPLGRAAGPGIVRRGGHRRIAERLQLLGIIGPAERSL
jgi:hypothetical protein